jgi:hypothetical protein
MELVWYFNNLKYNSLKQTKVSPTDFLMQPITHSLSEVSIDLFFETESCYVAHANLKL